MLLLLLLLLLLMGSHWLACVLGVLVVDSAVEIAFAGGTHCVLRLLLLMLVNQRNLLILLQHLLCWNLALILILRIRDLRHLRGKILQTVDLWMVLNLIDSLLNDLAQHVLELKDASSFTRVMHRKHLFKVQVCCISENIICIILSAAALIHKRRTLSKLLQKIVGSAQYCGTGL